MTDRWLEEYRIGMKFCSYNSEKVKVTEFENFLIFLFLSKYMFSELNFSVRYLPNGTTFVAEIFRVDLDHRVLQD